MEYISLENIIDLLVTWWQFTLVGILIIVGFIVNLFGVDCKEPRVNLRMAEMPIMQPITIPTKGKGFWGGIWIWLMGVRRWEIVQDFHYELDGQEYVIPAGFEFDGASVPKFLATWLSPVGVLLVGGLVHDYGYKYQTLLKSNKKETIGIKDQKWMDQTFRDINIEQNGFILLNYLAYWALRLGGFVAWNGHRKRNSQIEELK